MSKRSRRPRNDRPKKEGQALPAVDPQQAGSIDEPELMFSGQAFLEFDEWIDGQLEVLVQKWIHTAAPAAAILRRVMPQGSRRISGQT